ncbi:MAG: hypothetical protein RLZZ468_1295 [Cyanobacteriota bacterium]
MWRALPMNRTGMALMSAVLLGLPMSSFQLNQLQALNRELGRLCSSPPPQALSVCRIHAQLVRSL